MDYRTISKCRVCSSGRLLKYLDLGNVPLCNSLLTESSLSPKRYPIEVLLCQECFLSQLSIVVNPDLMYRDYPYQSSVSDTFKSHCFDLAVKLKREFPSISEHPLVVDIASNDGCLLKEFQKAGFQRLLGFDPASNLASNPYHWVDGKPSDDPIGISVVNEFFSHDTARRIKGDAIGGRASFITAQNVFAHVDDLADFLEGVKWFLDDNGVLIVEVPYMVNLINQCQFDTIYHEHLSYFLLGPLFDLFQQNGLPIFRVEELPIHGGSLRIYASKSYYPEEPSVDELLQYENQYGFYDESKYISFSSSVDGIKANLRHILEHLHNMDLTVMGYGASAKGISLLNYCDLRWPLIQSIVDDTPSKQGKLTPGSHIPIVSFEEFEKEKPSYIFILPWNFKDELMRKTSHMKAGYITAIPEVRIGK